MSPVNQLKSTHQRLSEAVERLSHLETVQIAALKQLNTGIDQHPYELIALALELVKLSPEEETMAEVTQLVNKCMQQAQKIEEEAKEFDAQAEQLLREAEEFEKRN